MFFKILTVSALSLTLLTGGALAQTASGTGSSTETGGGNSGNTSNGAPGGDTSGGMSVKGQNSTADQNTAPKTDGAKADCKPAAGGTQANGASGATNADSGHACP